jgi:hypothetical protein
VFARKTSLKSSFKTVFVRLEETVLKLDPIAVNKLGKQLILFFGYDRFALVGRQLHVRLTLNKTACGGDFWRYN